VAGYIHAPPLNLAGMVPIFVNKINLRFDDKKVKAQCRLFALCLTSSRALLWRHQPGAARYADDLPSLMMTSSRGGFARLMDERCFAHPGNLANPILPPPAPGGDTIHHGISIDGTHRTHTPCPNAVERTLGGSGM